MSAHEAAWLAMLLAAAGWAFLSAVEVDACAFEGAERGGLGLGGVLRDILLVGTHAGYPVRTPTPLRGGG